MRGPPPRLDEQPRRASPGPGERVGTRVQLVGALEDQAGLRAPGEALAGEAREVRRALFFRRVEEDAPGRLPEQGEVGVVDGREHQPDRYLRAAGWR